MKALVTGANGFIGSNLIRELLAHNYEVRGMVRQSSDLRALDGVDVELVCGDLQALKSIEAAAQDREIVFHVAGVFAYWGVPGDDLIQNSVEGTRNVLDACSRAGVRRIVVTSSSVACGSSTTKEIRDETHQLARDDQAPYVVAKAIQERTAFEEALKLDIECLAVLPAMTVGPYDYRLLPSNALLVNFLKDPFRHTFHGGVNIVSVRDVARGHRLVAEQGLGGERYLLAGENLDYLTLHQRIARLCGVPAPIAPMTHTAAVLSATFLEAVARVSGANPSFTRDEARMLGRYYWYSHDKAVRLGYAPRCATQALAEAFGWLVVSPHVSKALRRKLRLSREVYAARAADLPGYRRLA